MKPVLLLLAVFLFVPLSVLNAAPSTQPNIVLILADDLGYGDVRCYNDQSKIPTPHIDRLAREGMRFTDAHSPCTVCTPTRYSLMTGQMAFRVPNGGTVFTGVGGPSLSVRHGLLSLGVAAYYGTVQIAPARVRVVDRSRGILRLRFRNPEYRLGFVNSGRTVGVVPQLGNFGPELSFGVVSQRLGRVASQSLPSAPWRSPRSGSNENKPCNASLCFSLPS